MDQNSRKLLRRLPLVALVLALLACSNRGIYEGVQAGNRNDCLMLPPVQYEECMARSSQSFEEYEQERREAGER